MPLQRLSVVAESPAADAPDQSSMLFPKWLDPSIAAAAVASLRNMSEVRAPGRPSSQGQGSVLLSYLSNIRHQYLQQ